MDTRRTTARRVEEEVANAGATPQGNRIPCQEKVVVNDQVPINALAMKDGEVTQPFSKWPKPSLLNLKP